MGPFRWVALSGDPEDIYRTDAKVRELLPDDQHLHHWLDMARARIQFQGLPARICWVGLGDRHRLGLAFNEMVALGALKAPIVIGRDHLDSGSVASPNRETEAMRDGSDAVADWPLLNALLNTASGATWVSIHHGGGVGMGYSQHAGVVIVCDGSAAAARRIERVLWNDPASGVMRHADAGYESAIECARERGTEPAVPRARRAGPRNERRAAAVAQRPPRHRCARRALRGTRRAAHPRPAHRVGGRGSGAARGERAPKCTISAAPGSRPDSSTATRTWCSPVPAPTSTPNACAGLPTRSWRAPAAASSQACAPCVPPARKSCSRRAPRASRRSCAEGVTTIEIKSGYGLTLDDEAKMLRVARALGRAFPVTVRTSLLAAHTLPPEYRGRAR